VAGAMIGSKLANRYEVVRELGRGGMGVVYLGRDPLLDREVAVKLIAQHALTPELRFRFLREARVVARMDHPGVVGVYDIGEHEDNLFFVMPLVPGTNLRSLLDGGALNLGELVELGVQAAEALQYSHSLGVVHRDVKPENMLVVREPGEGLRVRITDFGLAVISSEQRLTRTGAVLGTVAYLSPEQIASQPVDERVDVYALGTVLYECAAGKVPFAGSDAQSTLYRIAHERPRPLRAVLADIDDELDATIMACLEKDPARRTQSARQLAAALAQYRAKLASTGRTSTILTTMTAAPGVATPARALVGRERELADLQNRLDAALDGECQLVLIGGERGIGKSRLLEELEHLAQARHIRVLHGQFAETGAGLAYQGFCEIVESFARRSSVGGSSGVDLSDLEPDLLALFPSLGEIALPRSQSSGPRPQAVANVAPEADKARVFELIARTLTRIGAGAPLVLLLEDLHAASVSIDALHHVARRLGSTPTLIVGTFTSTEIDRAHPLSKLIDELSGTKRFQLIDLPRLTFAEHRALVETLAGTRVDDSFVRRLYEISEGNPYFTCELVRSILDSGSVVRDSLGSLTISDELPNPLDSLPETVQNAVARRIERLPERLRHVLSMAAVLGKSFDEADLHALLVALHDSEELDSAIDCLLREGFLEERRQGRGDRLAFTSAAMHGVLYGGIPRRKRRGLHRLIAEDLEKRHTGRVERVRGQLVHHYAQADVADKVVEYGLPLARSALAAFSADGAVRAARAVLRFVDDEAPALAAETRLLLASAHRMAGDMDAAYREIEGALRACDVAPDSGRTLRVLVSAAEIAWQALRPDDAKKWLDRGLELARAHGCDGDAPPRLLALGITIANLRGDSASASALTAEANAHPESERQPLSEGRRGGALTIPLGERLPSLDPLQAFTAEQGDVLACCFETLVREVKGARIAPWLAESFDAEDGGRRFRCRLRQGVRFHDGKELTAQDVRYSIERFLSEPTNGHASALAAIAGARRVLAGETRRLEGLRVVSERELTFDLEQRLAFFPALFANATTSIVAEGTTRFHGSWRDGCVGTGPFRLARLEPNRVIEMEASAAYWRSGRPRADSLVFLLGQSPADSLVRLRAGQCSLASNIAHGDVDALRQDPAFASRFREAPNLTTYALFFNVRGGPFANLELRRAVASGIDVASIVGVLGRHVTRARGFLPTVLVGQDASPIDPPAPGRDGLCEVDATCLVHPVFDAQYQAAAGMLLAELRRLGVHLRVQTGLLSTCQDDVDLYLGRWAGDYPDPDTFVHGALHSQAGAFGELCGHPLVDGLGDAARAETEPRSRRAIYRDVERALRDEAVLVPLFYDKSYTFEHPNLRGMDDALGATTRLADYAELWLED
jgi:ABC-type transport system substrate-binding protein